MHKMISGTIAGGIATIPMSWAMEVMHRMLPLDEQQPLPPRTISERALRKLEIHHNLTHQQRFWFALLAHLGYGAIVGGVYQALSPSKKGSLVSRGILYGLGVWGVSYLGLMPALGMLTPATRHPVRRSAVMILAHLVFGSALAVFSGPLLHTDDEELQFLGSHHHTRGHPRERTRHGPN